MVKPFHFFAFLLFTAIVFVSIYGTEPFNFSAIIFVFVLIPILDALIGVNASNPDAESEIKWKKLSVWGPAIYLYSLSHFVILYFALVEAQQQSIEAACLMGISVGLYTGGLGITVAHELCHKREKFNQVLADVLLASVCYTHFAIEHVRGHHFAVATPNDPASARRGESVYKFLPRTLCGSFMSACKIDLKLVLQGLVMTIGFVLVVFLIAGAVGLIFFVIQSIVAIILLELVNYVEHYGLSRKQLSNGRFEIVNPHHSWNSSHVFSNLLLFNLQRHSDHHASAHLPYPVLKHHESAPQLVSGYPGMILLALVPPLWFKLMDANE